MTNEIKRKGKNWRRRGTRGVTLIELFIVLAIISILSSIAIIHYGKFVDESKNTLAILDIKKIVPLIVEFKEKNHVFPDSLDQLEGGPFIDPWGNPYQYVNIGTAHHKYWRRDRNNKPINSYFDLWSNGEDGKTQININASKARDDIVYAMDGAFVGLGSELDDLLSGHEGGGEEGQSKGKGKGKS